MAEDMEFEAASRYHIDTQRSSKRYNKRHNVLLQTINVQVSQQAYVDLKAMAEVSQVSMGVMVDSLIDREVRRRARKMVAQAEK